MMNSDWRLRAACKDDPTSLFFLEPGGDPRPAKAICAICPVTKECYDYAVEARVDHGIWGGMSIEDIKRERRRIQKQERRARSRAYAARTILEPRYAANVGKHGTRGGYVQGCRCEDCTAAERAYYHKRKLLA